jgi:hypothetical protein
MGDVKLQPNEYDGIYFLPGEEDDELVIHCWEFKANTEYAGATPIEGNKIGNMYHIAFFRRDEEGNPIFDDHYEAILGDPESYIRNLVGAGLYGCVVRKTTKTGKWFDNYLTSVVDSVIVDNVKSITNLK